MKKHAFKKKSWLKTAKAKQLFSFCRWLHIYVSCALFTLLLFFSITGVTLNHPNWTNTSPAKIDEFRLPDEIIFDEQGEYQLKAIEQYIKEITNLSKPRSIDVALDIGEITYDYPLPAGYTFVTVLLTDKIIEVEHVKGSRLALLNDLHKGRHTGEYWSWLIDISAMLMLLFTLAGLVILFQNAKHRRMASFVLLIGMLTPAFIYFAAVPRLNY